MSKGSKGPRTDDLSRRRRKLFRPDPPPLPDDPELEELCRRHAEDCDDIWAGDSDVVLDAMQKAFEGEPELEEE